MSYGCSAALQAAIFQRLSEDADLGILVGDAIFDAPPFGEIPPIYVSLGPEEVRDASDKTGAGASHALTISVISEAAGFSEMKAAALAVCDALLGASFVLARGRLVSIRFERATARRVGVNDLRRIDLRFVARVEDE